MSPVAALHYDGRSSAARPVTVEFDVAVHAGPLLAVVTRDGNRLRYAYSACVPDMNVGSARRLLELPDGGMLEITDTSGWDALLRDHRLQRADRLLGRVERRWLAVAGALVVSVIALGAAFKHGVPALVDRGLALVPPELDARIGAGGLALLDKQLFEPSLLPIDRRKELRSAFADVARDGAMAGRVRLEFRRGQSAGPNAFALPDGIVVLTDELVALSRHDDELRAVFAHEIAHVAHRHAMRALLSSSLNTLLSMTVLGDVSSVTTLAASVPVTLAHAANSRAFEREADADARVWMDAAGVPPSRLGDLLARVERETSSGDWGYLSTHPPLAERQAAAER